MSKTKIDWCDYTYNYVIGCVNNCPYCYAKKINKRFKFTKNFNELEWREQMFQCEFPKKPSRIFLNSMSDIEHWKISWLDKTFNKIKNYSQHRFLFLTKNPIIYNAFEFPKNCWLGITITNQNQMKACNEILLYSNKNPNNYNLFISIEPILEKIELLFKPDWCIVGAETGKRKGKVYPDLKWIELLYEQCKENNIPFFMKDSLKYLWDGSLIQNYPEDLMFK